MYSIHPFNPCNDRTGFEARVRKCNDKFCTFQKKSDVYGTLDGVIINWSANDESFLGHLSGKRTTEII